MNQRVQTAGPSPLPATVDLDAVKRTSAGVSNASPAVTAARWRLANQRQANLVVGQPHLTTTLNLDEPFLIWELPRPLPGFDPHDTPGASSVALNILEHAGGDRLQCIFYFLWNNPSAFAAVINVTTTMRLKGLVQVIGDSGIFAGDTSEAAMSCELDILRWSGWGPDPVTGASTDETPLPFAQATQSHNLGTLTATGGHFQQIQRQQSFDLTANLSAALLAIPAHAVTMFQVTFTAQWGLSGNGGANRVAIDFGSAAFGRNIICPGLSLEILTPTASGTRIGTTTTGNATTTSTAHL
jgi:hypothetical protein